MNRILYVLALCVMSFSAAVLADTLTLSDGTVLEGKVVQQGEKYWIKTTTGESRFIKKTDVKSWTKGASGAAAAPAPAAPNAPVTAAPAPAPAAPSAPVTSGGASTNPVGANLSFAETKSKADRVDAPLAAVGLWQAYVDSNDNASDIATAKEELEKWKKLDADKAEKINGKWVGGEERKKLIEKVRALLKEADTMEGKQTLQAVGKLQEAVKLYPNNWEANFELGYFYLHKGSNSQFDQAIKSLEVAAKLRPNSAATLSNLAIAYNFRQRYEQSVLAAYKAAQLEDSKEIVQNLINSISQAPPGMRQNNNKVRPIMEEARLLASKYGIADGRQSWIYVRPKGHDAVGSDVGEEGPAGVIGNGSGFLVSADGYILTNRHVAAEKNCTFMVRFSDGKQKPATVVCIDDDADVALLKVKSVKNKPYTFLQLADAEAPGTGAECAALGFPVGHVMGYSMQVTAGTVSSVNPSEPYHVTLTCKITHGNSGGPLVDKFGNVIGIVSAGLTAYTETYGKALSAGQVRKFLDKNKDKYTGTFTPASKGEAKLDTEEIYKKDSPATVCILLIREKSGGD